MDQPRATRLLERFSIARPGMRVLDYGCGDRNARRHFEALGFEYSGWDIEGAHEQLHPAPLVNLSYVLNVLPDVSERRDVVQRAWALAEDALLVTVPPAFRIERAGKCCQRPLTELHHTLASEQDWSDRNEAWLKETLGTRYVHRLGGDVYLVTRAKSCFGQSVTGHTQAFPLAAGRREVLGWFPKALAALGLLSLATPAFAAMSWGDVRNVVVEILAKYVPNGNFVPEAHLTEDVGLDSLDRFEVMLEVEDAFQIEIPDNEAEKIMTVGTLIDYVYRRVSGR